MLVTLIRLIFLLLIIYVLYKLVTLLMRTGQKLRDFRNSPEECPACFAQFHVDKQCMTCPKCSAKLGRNHKGELLIRINEEA